MTRKATATCREHPPLPAAERLQVDGRRRGLCPGRRRADLGDSSTIHSGWKIDGSADWSSASYWSSFRVDHQRRPFVAFVEVGPDPGSPRRASRYRRDPELPNRCGVRADRPLRRRASADATYADALVAIGPAAVKLGQALSTRPDLVGGSPAKISRSSRTTFRPPPSLDQADDRAELRRTA